MSLSKSMIAFRKEYDRLEKTLMSRPDAFPKIITGFPTMDLQCIGGGHIVNIYGTTGSGKTAILNTMCNANDYSMHFTEGYKRRSKRFHAHEILERVKESPECVLAIHMNCIDFEEFKPDAPPLWENRRNFLLSLRKILINNKKFAFIENQLSRKPTGITSTKSIDEMLCDYSFVVKDNTVTCIKNRTNPKRKSFKIAIERSNTLPLKTLAKEITSHDA